MLLSQDCIQTRWGWFAHPAQLFTVCSALVQINEVFVPTDKSCNAYTLKKPNVLAILNSLFLVPSKALSAALPGGPVLALQDISQRLSASLLGEHKIWCVKHSV